MASKIYIVIPHYGKYELLHARLWELFKYCRTQIEEILVVDDCSLDDALEGGLRWWAELRVKHDFQVTALSCPENVGFLRASNFGMGEVLKLPNLSDDDVIVLLGNDVEIRTDFIGQITHLLGQPEKTIVGGMLLNQDTGWNKFGERIFPYLEGWLLAAKISAWKEIGLFDTRYAPNDYEDVDWSTTALQRGYWLAPLNNPGLHHLGAQTIGYNPTRLTQTNLNKKKFEEKWRNIN